MKKGRCPSCGSDQLIYAYDATQYYTFRTEEFPLEPGEKIIKNNPINDIIYREWIVCDNCHLRFSINGKHLLEE